MCQVEKKIFHSKTDGGRKTTKLRSGSASADVCLCKNATATPSGRIQSPSLCYFAICSASRLFTCKCNKGKPSLVFLHIINHLTCSPDSGISHLGGGTKK